MKGKNVVGQSSMEFLMTYGWVILIILVAVVVVWQWGLFSVGETVTPGTFGFWGVEPNDFIMHKNGVLELGLINNLGVNVTLIYYNATMADKSSNCGGSCVSVITPDNVKTVTLNNLMTYVSGKRFEVDVFIKYNDTRTGKIAHVSAGKIWGNYED